ncbi:MAG: hypothetical protein L3J84_01035 [Gammaproteobacteria bacterium]|nr:hypothetical protein [Gammaproteobacteria bacterium]
MSSAVQDVKDLIDHLPDDTSIEDIQYHLYVLEKIRRGQNLFFHRKLGRTETHIIDRSGRRIT